ncbi:1-acylglycerol-3-phosphate O-acyltransferase [secondary endosymbiont of Ctenarytaina eucalypti]|uniref:1-acyl-sn-glycerol-3-phosphate acyltransferase n=1 Tax=secondary endosymbiont of Ctenarytaina eucalypti TaxID=1199245 RepID=J3YS86_9ENTR|nr:1-acylglycerol-3-phosphate O-acyltransferase [secondary endosymbiont of Ctenarytaina eucalypti]AFP85048.1 1-acyl-sn-glycerol-3-phosphate acyltransferase [secondary endosymbiont of Ctenarytaina eucalypti]
MLVILRTMLVMLLSISICVVGLIYCFFSPRDPRHVATFGRWFGRMSPLFGIQVEVRRPAGVTLPKNCIYIANHQNNYDMVTVASVVQPRTVTVGKKSLLWIPLFGPLYWLTGNLLIDRNNSSRAHTTLSKMALKIKKQNISIWIFPEGTRSRGRGLLPFKTGAFYTAIAAEVPIVPICVSNTSNKIKLNRWSNGLVIIEILPPVATTGYSPEQVRALTRNCWEVMKKKLDDLNAEVTKRDILNR